MKNGNIIFEKKAMRRRKKDIWENDKMNGHRMNNKWRAKKL